MSDDKKPPWLGKVVECSIHSNNENSQSPCPPQARRPAIGKLSQSVAVISTTVYIF